MKRIVDYSFGDILYRYVYRLGIFKYRVLGIAIAKSLTKPYLVVECLTCTHGSRCKIVLTENDWGELISTHMNHTSEEYIQEHAYFHHQGENFHFHSSEDLVREEVKKFQATQREKDSYDMRNKLRDLRGEEKFLREVIGTERLESNLKLVAEDVEVKDLLYMNNRAEIITFKVTGKLIREGSTELLTTPRDNSCGCEHVTGTSNMGTHIKYCMNDEEETCRYCRKIYGQLYHSIEDARLMMLLSKLEDIQVSISKVEASLTELRSSDE